MLLLFLHQLFQTMIHKMSYAIFLHSMPSYPWIIWMLHNYFRPSFLNTIW